MEEQHQIQVSVAVGCMSTAWFTRPWSGNIFIAPANRSDSIFDSFDMDSSRARTLEFEAPQGEIKQLGY